jgi:TPR repeat protein
MRLTSSNQRLGAGTDRGVQGNAIPENPAPVSPLPPNESSMKYRYKDYDSNLSEIIALPKITGTALVLAFGNEMECIRSLGDAPPIGSRGHAGVGLTGISFSSGKVELCNDVENDSRADLQACADLGVRSVLVVPIRHSSRVAGVLEALSSEPGAFDWRTIRHIRRLAQAFDPVTLESWVYSPERQDGLEQAASLQNRSGAPTIPSAHEDRGTKFGEAQPEYEERQRAFAALQPIKELPSQRCMDPPAFGAREDAAPSFATLEEEVPGKSRPRPFVGLAIAFIILFVCFFAFRTHLTSLNGLLDFAPRLPRASSRSSAATSPKGLRNGPPSESAPGSDLSVKKSAPSPRTAVPQSSGGAIAPVQKPGQNTNADASWQLALAYLKGIGVQQDERQAAKWLKKAANLGDPRAQAALSDLYLRGIGVQRDYVRAYTWASIAGRLGGEGERLVTLRQRMTRSELEDANRRVQTWFHAQTLSR